MLRLMWPFAVIVAGMAAGAAFAHAFLSGAAPAVGTTVPAPPKEIRLTFSEAIEPRFSGVELATGDGRRVTTGSAVADPANDRQLVLVLPPLVPGRYRVSWHVVSVDTHRTEGEYSFTIAP